MEETISRMAGSQNGSYKTISQLAALVAPTGRQLRQRTTLYGPVSAERIAAAAASDGVCDSVRGHSRASPSLADTAGPAPRRSLPLIEA
jgi:FO synthase